MNKNIEYLTKRIFTGEESSLVASTSKQNIHSCSIPLKGYKHSFVQIVSLLIALNQKGVIENPPLVNDTYVLCAIVNVLGGKAEITNDRLRIDPTTISNYDIPLALCRMIHASMYLMPALMMRLGRFTYFGSGGDRIANAEINGVRSNEHIIDIMRRCGGNIECKTGRIEGFQESPSMIDMIDIMDYSNDKNCLSGYLVGGATKTAIIMSLFRDRIEIRNPYVKTDVLDMLRFMELMKRKVTICNDKIVIENKAHVTDGYVHFELTQCVSDIITYSTLAIMNNVEVRFEKINRTTIEMGLKPEFELFDQINVKYKWENNNLIILKNQQIKAANITITPTGIQSDHQPFFALILLLADGKSYICEQVFNERFHYVKNLKRLGANMNVKGNTLEIIPTKLKYSVIDLHGQDVRTDAVTLLASITSGTKCVIYDCSHLLRGYNALKENLKRFGIEILFRLEKENEGIIDC